MKGRKEITISSYDETANEYFKIVSEFDLIPEIFEFTKLIKQNGRILDLGCGPGHHSKYFSNLDFKVTGIDLSSEMIKLAKKEFADVNFKVMDILDLDFEKNSFDGIWASASLLHIPKNHIKLILNKIKDALINDGILYISLKEGKGSELFNDIRYGGVNKFYVYYQLDKIKKILKDVGFNILEIKLKGKRTNYDTNSWLHIFCQNKK
ncbi:class I SAM-dependent methyltransferase [Flavobacterium yafengii]|uniref:Class I SAM-dependent methyltransferase n=1 Tax=Flavobacterium yafengii TaxID=3041253 RepID=A0AAW6TNB1_9FLAO|nr:class I SAM-dependent methyltransferase [Flavobacterium yafengii]MDI5950279.1 class I SAM-dependent methyltransferase [Flavobacterium yafengii]